MNKKIIVTLIVLLFCVGCLGIVSADNSTNETSENNESMDLDLSNYILPISITSDGIEFSDGFTGFCLDSTKESITTEDGFTSEKTGSDEIQNYVKLAIVEAYKQGCEDNLGQIITSFADGSYKNSDDKVITAVLESQEKIDDKAVADLEDSIEGTFEFELLKPADGNKSDCLAYKVSLKEVPSEDKLAAVADDNATEELDKNNDTEDALTNSSDDNQDKEKATDSTNDTVDDEKTAVSKDDTEKDKKTEDAKDNETDEPAENATDENKTPEKIVNETNKTIINKTNTLIVNENNTTIVNNTNIKHINNVTNDTPGNETIQDKLIKTVGNPIFILIVVIAIAAIAAVAMRRKDQ